VQVNGARTEGKALAGGMCAGGGCFVTGGDVGGEVSQRTGRGGFSPCTVCRPVLHVVLGVRGRIVLS
jgi:hypothetical protein